jgi:hypothetical protein
MKKMRVRKDVEYLDDPNYIGIAERMKELAGKIIYLYDDYTWDDRVLAGTQEGGRWVWDINWLQRPCDYTNEEET